MERLELLRSSGEIRTSRRKVRKRRGKSDMRRKRKAEPNRRDVSATRSEIQRICVAKKKLFSSASLETKLAFCNDKINNYVAYLIIG